MKSSTKVVVSTAVAGVLSLVAAGTFAAGPAAAATVKCQEANACKGQGKCKSNANKCKAGSNSCKGAIMWTPDAAACTAAGGHVVEAPAKTK